MTKRIRIDWEQLERLEEVFLISRKPCSQAKKDLAEELRLTEKQVQVWFQNRRAKEKRFAREAQRMLKPRGTWPSSQNCPSVISLALDPEHLNAHGGEDSRVVFVPCGRVSVGTWTHSNRSDIGSSLVAYVCRASQMVSWFIQYEGRGFKISIPFDTIVLAELEDRSLPLPATPTVGRVGNQEYNSSVVQAIAILHLARPPVFAVNDLRLFQPWSRKGWRPTDDWTEGQQATHVLQHRLEGPLIFLRHLVEFLNQQTKSDQGLRTTFASEQFEGRAWPTKPGNATRTSVVPRLGCIPNPQNICFSAVESGLLPSIDKDGLPPVVNNECLPLAPSDTTLPAITPLRRDVQQGQLHPSETGSPKNPLGQDGSALNLQPQVLPGFYEDVLRVDPNFQPNSSLTPGPPTPYTPFPDLWHYDSGPFDSLALSGIPTLTEPDGPSAPAPNVQQYDDGHTSQFQAQLNLPQPTYPWGLNPPAQHSLSQWELGYSIWPETPPLPAETSASPSSARSAQQSRSFSPDSASPPPFLTDVTPPPSSSSTSPIGACFTHQDRIYLAETPGPPLLAPFTTPNTLSAQTYDGEADSASDGAVVKPSNLLDDILRLQRVRAVDV